MGTSKGYQYGYFVTLNGYAPDNSGKDDNFRGETIFNRTLFVSKGAETTALIPFIKSALPGAPAQSPEWGGAAGFSASLWALRQEHRRDVLLTSA